MNEAKAMEEMKRLKGTQTEKNLASAFAGESQAHVKYTLFARQAEKRGEKISLDRVNTWKLAETVLASMNIQGWKKTKIKYYIAVYNAGRQDLLDQIENGTLSVKSAYETINEKRKNERNAGRKSNKIAPFRRASKEFFLEAEKREYSAAEVNELKKIYDSLGKIIAKNE